MVEVNVERVRIDREALQTKGLLPPQDVDSRMAREMRQIKRAVLKRAAPAFKAAEPCKRSILVASALSGDGKSFTSLNLALSIALEKNFSVLLVDADIARQHLTRGLGLAGAPGLLDVARAGAMDPDSLVRPTDVAGLSVLAAGVQDEGDPELCASERMRDVLRQLAAADARRIVVFDSSPLLLTTEAREFAAAAGQILLVVRSCVTPEAAVVDALALLDEEACVDLLLVGVPRSRIRDRLVRYGYGYGYGYEDDYARHEPPVERPSV